MVNARRRTILKATAGISALLAGGLSIGRPSKIMVLGVGGAGRHVIDLMSFRQSDGLSYVTCDVDPGNRERRLEIAEINLDFEAVEQSAWRFTNAADSRRRIASAVSRVRRFVLVAHMGGRSGSLLVPAIARIAREAATETCAVVALPFDFEGSKRSLRALRGIREIACDVDRVAVISANNQIPKSATDVSMVLLYERLAIALRDEVLAAVS
jgi:cell division protein FtsZ